VFDSELWRHSEEDVKRDDAVERLIEMLKDLIGRSQKNKLLLAPVIGIGCPGVIHEDGSIARGAQNLPGNWESSRFNLPHRIREEIEKIGDHETMVVMPSVTSWEHLNRNGVCAGNGQAQSNGSSQ
jgi:hypothetical protein